ncbi:MAG: TetR/AcrR family transcriptional regulator, partial [Streptococcus sp.]
NVSVEIVSALFRTIAMTILHIEEIGEEQFDTTLKLVIQGVVEQITKEDR